MNWYKHIVASGTSHKYATVMAKFPIGNISKEIIDFGEKIPDRELVFETEKEDELGRETDIHVTVLYGLHSDNVEKMKEFLEDQKPLVLTLGKTSMFDKNDDYDVLKISISGKDIFNLNKKIADNFQYTSNYPEYIPHCTIAYMKKGKAKKYINDNIFEGKKVKIDKLIFSAKDHTKTEIILK